MERGADAQLAVYPQDSAHHFHQAPADGQPQAGAAKAPRGRGVDLAKGLEEVVDTVGGDADPRVAHGELDHIAVVGDALNAGGDHDFAQLGKLDGIANEVG